MKNLEGITLSEVKERDLEATSIKVTNYSNTNDSDNFADCYKENDVFQGYDDFADCYKENEVSEDYDDFADCYKENDVSQDYDDFADCRKRSL